MPEVSFVYKALQETPWIVTISNQKPDNNLSDLVTLKKVGLVSSQIIGNIIEMIGERKR